MSTAATPAVRITIDGRQIECAPDRMLIDVLREHGIEVPTLCHDRRLMPWGGCRVCLVARTDGRPRLVPACSTPVARGMVIDTRAPEVLEQRRRQLQLLVLDHRMECPVCERGGDCRLQDLIYRLGPAEERLPFDRPSRPRDEKSPIIVRDPEKCILCGRCYRLCDEIQGVGAIGYVERGLNSRITTLLERPLDCEFCGQCVNACPVAALTARPYVGHVPAWLRQREVTTCSWCGCGCRIEVWSHEGRIERVTGPVDAEPNHGKLCARGWLGWDVLDAPERLQRPLVRRGERLEAIDWPHALELAAGKLAEARGAGERVGAIGGTRLLVEDALSLRLLYREGLQGEAALAPDGGLEALAAGAFAASGRPRSSATFEDLRHAPLALVLRADPTRTHPLIKTELVQKLRQREERVILAHGLSGGLARHASRMLALQPARDAALLAGLAAEIVRQDPERARGLDGVPGFAGWREELAGWSLARTAAATGCGVEEIAGVAAELAACPETVAVVCCGTGIPGDEEVVTRLAFELMTLVRGDGSIGRVLVAGEKAGLQGAIDAGLDHRFGPGAVPESGRPAAAELLAAAGKGELSVLHLVACDPAGSWPGRSRWEQALSGAPFVIAQTPFLTASARRADLVLPVRLLGERAGTLVGADGIARDVRAAAAGPAGLPQDHELLEVLARRAGVDIPEGEALADLAAQRLAQARGIAPEPRFGAVPGQPDVPPVPKEYLDPSPQLFHNGTTSEHSRTLCELAPPVAVRISPQDARRLGVSSGDMVEIQVAGRTLLQRARVDHDVRPGRYSVHWSGRTDSPAGLLDEAGDLLEASVRRSR